MVLNLEVGGTEVYDEKTSRFYTIDKVAYVFEHSLFSVSKWEEYYKKPFPLINNKQFESNEEILYYISCMEVFTTDVNFSLFGEEEINKIVTYMGEKHTATTISSKDEGGRSSFTTSEVIYAMMANGQVPFECDKWNLDRLMTLLAVISEFNKPKKPMPQSEALKQQAMLNQMRRRSGSG